MNNALITLHTPGTGRLIVVNAYKIESLVEQAAPNGQGFYDGNGVWRSVKLVTKVNMDSGDQGECRESIPEILEMLRSINVQESDV